MNDPEQAAAYAGHDLDNAYWLFEQCFKKYFPELLPNGAILDIGCGPAAIALRLARRFPDCEIHGVDGAPQMLSYGKKAVQRAGLEHQVRLICGILPGRLPTLRKRYEVIISNSFLHHLANPMILWNAIHDYSQPNAAVLIIDLLRPENNKQVQSLVDKYMPHAPSLLRQDMMHSLRAAFTQDEVRAQIQEAGLGESLFLNMASPFQFAAYGTLQKPL
jgi:cyclopropane fatty-acyl-phospholipid synthase-like methyltransferase